MWSPIQESSNHHIENPSWKKTTKSQKFRRLLMDLLSTTLYFCHCYTTKEQKNKLLQFTYKKRTSKENLVAMSYSCKAENFICSQAYASLPKKMRGLPSCSNHLICVLCHNFWTNWDSESEFQTRSAPQNDRLNLSFVIYIYVLFQGSVFYFQFIHSKIEKYLNTLPSKNIQTEKEKKPKYFAPKSPGLW